MPLQNTDSVPDQHAVDAWVATPEDTGKQPEPGMRSWLTESGLLTARLRGACGDAFRLVVLEQLAPAAASATQRRIVLRCGDKACVYAETLIPESTIARYPWLAVLGDEPLGERLSSQPGVTRSAFRYRLISGAMLPAELTVADQELWARQSEFSIGEYALTVTEVFLPDLQHGAAAN